MENASNALLIAGGVLIGVLILSLAVYLFADFGSTSRDIHAQQEVRQLEEFNSKFLVYEGRTNLTIHDIITIAGYALENNEYYENEENYYITIDLKSTNGITKGFETTLKNDYNGRIYDEQKNSNKTITYTCENIKYNEKTGRVNYILFEQNP